MVKEWHIYLLIGRKWWGQQLIAISVVGSFVFFFFLELVMAECAVEPFWFYYIIHLFSVLLNRPFQLLLFHPHHSISNFAFLNEYECWQLVDLECLRHFLLSFIPWIQISSQVVKINYQKKKISFIYYVCCKNASNTLFHTFFWTHPVLLVKFFWRWQNFVG